VVALICLGKEVPAFVDRPSKYEGNTMLITQSNSDLCPIINDSRRRFEKGLA
jgi:hypothetical protein